MDIENEELKKKIIELENELIETKEHLKKYTSPVSNKIYYEENKEKHKKNVKDYREKTKYYESISAEKKKEYARQAYLNKKAKKKLNENENEII